MREEAAKRSSIVQMTAQTQKPAKKTKRMKNKNMPDIDDEEFNINIDPTVFGFDAP